MTPSRRVAVLLTALVAFGPVSTDLYLASLPDMGRVFDAPPAVVQLTLSAFLAGFAACMLVHGPLSDRFGRRPVIIAGIAVYLAATVLCILAPSIEALIAGRFLQALGACVGPVVGRAVVRDLYPREQAAQVLSYMASAMALAPFAAPILGGWVHALWGWRGNFVLLFVFGAVLLAGVWRILAETNRHPDRDALAPSRMLANYRALLGDRGFLGRALVVACGFAGMFTFISASSFVLIDRMGLPPSLFGLGFAVVVAGYIAGAFLAGRWSRQVGLDRMIRFGAWGCAGFGLLLAALPLAGAPAMAGFLLPMMGFFFCAALSLPNATAAAIAPFPRMAGAASALVGFIQMVAGSTAGWVAVLLLDHGLGAIGLQMLALGVGCILAERVRPIREHG